MTPQQIAADIARGKEIVDEIKRLEAELRAIESRLEQAGLAGDQVPLQDKDREGKQFLARGHRLIVPVRFESDLIAGSFDPDSVMHKAVLSALGEEHAAKLPLFFKDKRTFTRVPKDGQAFRRLARKQLDPDTMAKLVSAVTQKDKAGIPKSKTVVAWDDAKPLDQVAPA
jgi:hypothetical protein